MNISEAMLKRGGEVDLPMMPGDTYTSKAIRYCDGMFEIYHFPTGRVDYRYKSLNDCIRHTNKLCGLRDVGVE